MAFLASSSALLLWSFVDEAVIQARTSVPSCGQAEPLSPEAARLAELREKRRSAHETMRRVAHLEGYIDLYQLPEEEKERAENGWKGLLFDRLKAMLGGSVLG